MFIANARDEKKKWKLSLVGGKAGSGGPSQRMALRGSLEGISIQKRELF